MEQPLKKYGACNLSSINLSEYVINPFTNNAYVDQTALSKDIPIYVRAMDDVLEENLNNHALPEQKESAERFRNLGIGVMGLHDMLIKLGLVYGSLKSTGFVRELMRFIFKESVRASANLAKQRSNFPGYDPIIWESTIIKNAFTDTEIQVLKEDNHLRNCSLLSVAPTGSIGTMLQISTGVEPWFAKSYTRNTKSLHGKDVSYEVWAPVIKEAMDRHWCPESLITANEISWKGRIEMQAALQDSVDTSISSTINLSKETTPKDIREIYMYAWINGLKGVTAYVDGSRDPILSTDTSDIKKEESSQSTPRYTFIKKVSDDCVGKKRTLMTGCGSLHFTAFFDKNTGKLLETYCAKGSQGGCALFMNGLSRMMSLAARGNISVEAIVDQLKSAGTCPSYAVRKATKQDTSKGSCCPVAIGYALMDMYNEMQNELKNQSYCNLETMKTVEKPNNGVKCPECGESLSMVEGCMSCNSCGFSRCG